MGLNIQKDEVIFIDTAPLIYYMENHPVHGEKLDFFIQLVEEGFQQWVTSFITCVEVLTRPRRDKNWALERKYLEFISKDFLFRVVQTTPEIMMQSVHFRAEYGFKTPDAIQLATAQVCEADVVITNDRAWKKVKELHVVTLDEL